jgi:CRISPR-associated protein Cmr4
MQLPPAPAKDEAWIAEPVDQAEVVAGGKIVLEEFTFTPKSDHQDFVKALGTWLAQHALPDGEAYQYWRDKLPKRLVILPEDAFRDFTQFSTEVVTRIKINQDTKTVAQGMLWTEESLPTDTLLYAPLMATAPRTGKNNLVDANKQTATSMLQLVESSLPSKHIQLGGDETVGRGTVCLRFGSVHEFTTNQKGN